MFDRSCQDEDLAAEISWRIDITPSCLLGSNKPPHNMEVKHTHTLKRVLFFPHLGCDHTSQKPILHFVLPKNTYICGFMPGAGLEQSGYLSLNLMSAEVTLPPCVHNKAWFTPTCACKKWNKSSHISSVIRGVCLCESRSFMK